MTIHIDIARSTATLAEVADLVENGETVLIDRAGKRIGALTPQTASPAASLNTRNAALFGAWAHLGPFSDDFLDSWMGPESDFDADKSLFPA